MFNTKGGAGFGHQSKLLPRAVLGGENRTRLTGKHRRASIGEVREVSEHRARWKRRQLRSGIDDANDAISGDSTSCIGSQAIERKYRSRRISWIESLPRSQQSTTLSRYLLSKPILMYYKDGLNSARPVRTDKVTKVSFECCQSVMFRNINRDVARL